MRPPLPFLVLPLAACAPAAGPRLDVATLPAAGAPERCLGNRQVTDWQPTEGRLMAGSAGRWWRNDMNGTCPILRPGRITIRRQTMDRACAGDWVEVTDPISRIGFGTCRLGEWVPVALPRGARF